MKLTTLSAEARALLDQAKRLRAEMDELPKDDPRRAQLEEQVRGLLRSANTIADAVTSSTRK